MTKHLGCKEKIIGIPFAKLYGQTKARIITVYKCRNNMILRVFLLCVVFLLSGCKAFEKMGIRATNVYQIKDNALIVPPDADDCPAPENGEEILLDKNTKKRKSPK